MAGETEAEGLSQVCLHCGVFSRQQFRAGYTCDKHAASRFVQRLTAAGIAREVPSRGRKLGTPGGLTVRQSESGATPP